MKNCRGIMATLSAVMLLSAPDVESHVMKIGYVTHDYPWFECPAEFFTGAVDDVRCYDRSLDKEPIASLAAGQEPEGRPAVSHWTFDKDGRDSHGGNHAMFSVGVALVEGRFGNAVRLSEGAHVAVFEKYDFDKLVWELAERQKLQRFWIYKAAVDGNWVRQLTGMPADPLATWQGRETVLIEDWDPCYLPDGGFAFISLCCVANKMDAWRHMMLGLRTPP